MASLPSVNPDQPIPNGPFSSPETWTLQSAVGPLITGSGICISSTGVVTATGGGGGGGTVTSIATGFGLTGGPISTTGTIALATSGVTAGVYQRANVTVDAYGRVTAISSNPASGTVCQITAGTGLSGGVITDTGTIALCDTTVTPGSYTNSSFTVNAQGQVTAASSGTAITSITAGTGLSGGTITSSGTIALTPSGVTAGTYTSPAIVVDTEGRITSAVDCSYVSSIATGAGLTGGPISSTGTIALADTSVGAGTYTFPTITVDAQGRLTSASDNTAVTCVCTGTGLTGGPISSTGTISLATLAPNPSGLYTLASVTLDAYGRVTGATSNDLSAAISTVAPLAIAGSATAVTLSVDSATTSASGVVSLVDNLTTNSTTTALTAAQGYSLKQQLDALATAVSSSTILGGTLDASTGNLLAVTSDGTSVGFVVGSPLPAASVTNQDYFVIVTTPGTFTPPGGSPVSATQGDWFLSNGSTWEFLNVGFDAPSASTSTPGLVQLATTAETQTGTSSSLAVTPAGAAGTYIPKFAYTTLGELQVGTGAGTYSALAVGTNGKVLAANSSTGTGLDWVTPCAGTVTSITTGTGLTGGAITTSGTIALASTAVTAGSYTYASLTVDAQGRLTAASSGTAPITAISGSAPIAVSAGSTPTVSIAASSTSQVGAVQLFDGTSSTSTTLAATANSVKTVYDLVSSALPLTGGTMTGAITFAAGQTFPIAGIQVATTSQFGVVQIGTNIKIAAGTISVDSGSTTVSGIVQLEDSTSSTSTTTAATPNSVKTAHDLASAALPKSGGTMSGVITFDAAQTFPAGSIQDATTGQKGIVQVGTNIQVAAGVISVDSASTTQVGVVQLNDSTASTSITEAATPNAVKTAYDAATSAQTDATAAQVIADAAIPDASYTASGDLLIGTGAGTYSALAAGPADYILSSDGAGTLQWVSQSEGDITSITGTSPIAINNTNPQTPIIGVSVASTTAAGVVQLNNSVASTSTTEAATANAVKTANDAATSAQTDASQAISDAAAAQVDATQALSDAATAQIDATQALSDASVAQSTADAALPKAGGTMTGVITFAPAQTFPAPVIQDATTSQKGVVQVGSNIQVSGGVISVNNATISQLGLVQVGNNIQVNTGTISVNSASTTQVGVVQLEDSVTCTSTTLAATANAVKNAYGLADAAIPKSVMTTKGDLMSASAASTPVALSVGTDGQVLTACAACTTGLTWVATGSGPSPATPTALGTVIGTTPSGTTNTGVGIGLCAGGTTAECVNNRAGNISIGYRAGLGQGVATPFAGGSVFIGQCAGELSSGLRNIMVGCGAGRCMALNESGTLIIGSNGHSFAGCSGHFILAGTTTEVAGTNSGAPFVYGNNCGAISFRTSAAVCTIDNCYGASGQFLQSRGSANSPTWAALPFATRIVGGVLYGCTKQFSTNTILGYAAHSNIALTGEGNTLLGGCVAPNRFCAGSTNNTVVGACAMPWAATTTGNIAIGFSALGDFTVGTPADILTGCCNTVIGTGSAPNLKCGASRNVIIGANIDAPNNTGSDQLAIGYSLGSPSTCKYWLTGCPDGNIKPGNSILDCTGSAGSAGQTLQATGTNALFWGPGIPGLANPGVPGTVIGYTSGGYTNGNTTLGFLSGNVLGNTPAGCYNTAIGESALTTTQTGDNFNTAVGAFSLGTNDLAACGNGCNLANTALGHCAGAVTSDKTIRSCNVYVGFCAGFEQAGSTACNTIVGAIAGSLSAAGASNNTLLGYNAQVSAASASNEIILGNASNAVIRAAVQTITTLSDARDKTEVVALPLGIDFVNALNPVKFTWEQREPNPVKDGTSEAGFIAQELQQAEQDFNAGGYLGLVFDGNPDKLEASSGKLIPVLVKAIQELSAENAEIKARLAQLEGNG